MSRQKRPTEEEISQRIAYVTRKKHEKGGLRELWCGLRHKTIPMLYSRKESISLLVVSSVLLRALLFAASIIVAALTRRAFAAGSPPITDLKTLLDVLPRAKWPDYALAAAGFLLAGAPKVLDYVREVRRLMTRAEPSRQAAFDHLRAALKTTKLRPDDDKVIPAEAITHVLHALSTQVKRLLADEGEDSSLQAVSFLAFEDENGEIMSTVATTKVAGSTGYPISSYKLMAYYAAVHVRDWFVEHDFQSLENPFEKGRHQGDLHEEPSYKSLLFFPVFHTEKVLHEETQTKSVQDYCLGVICFSCDRPFQFWRVGDHKKGKDGFGTVAYAESRFYIQLLASLCWGHDEIVALPLEEARS